MGNYKYGMILLESSLETLPSNIARTKKAIVLSKRYGIPPEFLLLDVSQFHDEMKRFGISVRRGRPDIVHQFLLASQYPPLNITGKLKVYVHTWKGDIIDVASEARIPKNYFQFVGLIQSLYLNGSVPPGDRPLLKLIRGVSLKKFLEEIGAKRLILMHERGRKATGEELKELIYPPYIFGIGGFPHGDFSEQIFSLSTDRISFLQGLQLDAWVAADRLLCLLEHSELLR